MEASLWKRNNSIISPMKCMHCQIEPFYVCSLWIYVPYNLLDNNKDLVEKSLPIRGKNVTSFDKHTNLYFFFIWEKLYGGYLSGGGGGIYPGGNYPDPLSIVTIRPPVTYHHHHLLLLPDQNPNIRT